LSASFAFPIADLGFGVDAEVAAKGFGVHLTKHGADLEKVLEL
jgi:hypothetical protein